MSFFKKILLEKDGFTLIEMLIVLMIISILLLIAVPNMLKSHDLVESKSCTATVKLVQSQVASYEMENDGAVPTLDQLKTEGYIDRVTCPGGESLTLVGDKVQGPAENGS